MRVGLESSKSLRSLGNCATSRGIVFRFCLAGLCFETTAVGLRRLRPETRERHCRNELTATRICQENWKKTRA
jgi:hypothetical protein